ncbi:MAG: crossover junction endodeoxyribonuclease RuvC [Blastochloris sp.]|nr:crossover junction endodeoxyribonuclease RuvC [Blastochloris sp.]
MSRPVRRIRREIDFSAPGVVGIDPSMSGFAVATARGSGPTRIEVYASKPPPDGAFVRQRLDRWLQVCDFVEQQLRPIQPRVVVIEQYAFSKAGSSLGELGGLYRHRIATLFPEVEIVEVAPNTLKKFITGTGAASKAQMVASVARLTEIPLRSDDEADAFGLAEIARALMGLPSPHLKLTEARLATLAKVKRPAKDL